MNKLSDLQDQIDVLMYLSLSDAGTVMDQDGNIYRSEHTEE